MEELHLHVLLKYKRCLSRNNTETISNPVRFQAKEKGKRTKCIQGNNMTHSPMAAIVILVRNKGKVQLEVKGGSFALGWCGFKTCPFWTINSHYKPSTQLAGGH